jgi:hypothetical protein
MVSATSLIDLVLTLLLDLMLTLRIVLVRTSLIDLVRTSLVNLVLSTSAQFPGGLQPGARTKDELVEAIKQRKRGMLVSALRHPFPSTTASASTLASTPGAAAGSAAGATSPAVYVEEGDDFIDVRVTEDGNPHADAGTSYCMSALVHEGEVPEGVTDVPDLPKVPEDERYGGMEWGYRLEEARTLVLGAEAVENAFTLWDIYGGWLCDVGAECMEPEGDEGDQVMRVVTAAYKAGQGIIVHSDCIPEEELVVRRLYD